MQPYHFMPDSGVLHELTDGNWVNEFQLAAFEGQKFTYRDQGINPETHQREILVIIEDNSAPPDGPKHPTYHPGQTTPFERGTENGVLLSSEKGGKRCDTIYTGYP